MAKKAKKRKYTKRVSLEEYAKTKSEIASLSAQLDDVTTKLETKLQEQIARLERILA